MPAKLLTEVTLVAVPGLCITAFVAMAPWVADITQWGFRNELMATLHAMPTRERTFASLSAHLSNHTRVQSPLYRPYSLPMHLWIPPKICGLRQLARSMQMQPIGYQWILSMFQNADKGQSLWLVPRPLQLALGRRCDGIGGDHCCKLVWFEQRTWLPWGI